MRAIRNRAPPSSDASAALAASTHEVPVEWLHLCPTPYNVCPHPGVHRAGAAGPSGRRQGRSRTTTGCVLLSRPRDVTDGPAVLQRHRDSLI